MAGPASGTIITIDNTSYTPTIAKALLCIGDGGTLILQPGIYFENSINLKNNATITANTSAGYGAEDTIIDAERSGRIFNTGDHSLTIDSLTLLNGKADHGGAIYSGPGGLNITSSEFNGCTADYGGAIYSCSGGTVIVSSSEFNGCLTFNSGGAILSGSGGTVTVKSSEFNDCSAVNSGGAIYIYTGSNLSIASSGFTGCSASSYSGGAIFSSSSSIVDITSSTFTECSAIWRGGAICSYKGGSIHSSRISRCSPEVPAVYSRNDFNATDNWWGTNEDPSGFTEGSVTYDPWLVLEAAPDPVILTNGGTSVIRANITRDMKGDSSSSGELVPDGIPVTFDLVGGSGSLSVTKGKTNGGVNGTAFTPADPGLATITAKADDQTVCALIWVTSGASFSVAPTAGVAPLTVNFFGNTNGSPTAWNWSFGDRTWYNTTDPALADVSHTYSGAGTYTVSLTVSRNGIRDTISSPDCITVTPGASLTAP